MYLFFVYVVLIGKILIRDFFNNPCYCILDWYKIFACIFILTVVYLKIHTFFLKIKVNFDYNYIGLLGVLQ